MKAFIAITLLAACAAASASQSIDYHTGLPRHLLKRDHSRLLKNVYGLDNSDMTYDTQTLQNLNTYPYTIPTSYNTVNNVNLNTLTLDEIIRHPLFQTYYTLPLFRQHFTHPLFRLYLTTPYFQTFWTRPIFTTFFRNPYLFNKYIYPVVYNPVTPTESIFGDYDTTTNTNTRVTDTVYPFNTGFPLNNNHVQYSHIMNKIFNTNNQYDIQTQTPVQKNIFHKIIDPVTGDIKYTVNTDDFKTIPHQGIDIDTIRERELIKNAILKKIFLNKVIYGDRRMGQTIRIPEIFNINKYDNLYPRDLVNNYETVIPRRDLINRYETIPREHETITIPREIFANIENIPRDLLAKYTIPKAINTKHITFNIPHDLLTKYENIPRELLAKYTIPATPVDLINNKHEMITIPRELIANLENIPRDLLAKYTIPRELTKKYETTPFGTINRFSTIPLELTTKNIEKKTVPLDTVEINKKLEKMVPITENIEVINNKIEKTIPIDIKTETTIPRAIEIMKKDDTEAILPNEVETIKKMDEIEDKIEKTMTPETETVENTRNKRHVQYVPLTHTVYTVPTTQYVVGTQQHYAQVPVTKDASTVYTVPATYTYAVQQPSYYYPVQTYITA